MKKIYTATLSRTGTTNADGNCCEWAYTESNEAEYGHEWDGDVLGYVENLDLEDGIIINGEYKGAIHNLPEDAIVLVYEGEPVEIYWVG